MEASRPLQQSKRAIVVGASSGIGMAVVRELAGRGWHVAALARRMPQLQQLAGEHVHVRAYQHDVLETDKVSELMQRIARDFDGLDLVLYVAGVQPPVELQEYNFEKDRQMVEVNLLGAMAWLNQAALRFSRLGRGHIAAVSSISGDRGRAAFPGYHASKGGLSIYLEALRNRLDKQGVRVTTIKPGFVDTPLLANASKTFWVISPAEAATQIVDAIEQNKQVVYIPARWRWVMLIIRNIPSFVMRRLNI